MNWRFLTPCDALWRILLTPGRVKPPPFCVEVRRRRRRCPRGRSGWSRSPSRQSSAEPLNRFRRKFRSDLKTLIWKREPNFTSLLLVILFRKKNLTFNETFEPERCVVWFQGPCNVFQNTCEDNSMLRQDLLAIKERELQVTTLFFSHRLLWLSREKLGMKEFYCKEIKFLCKMKG